MSLTAKDKLKLYKLTKEQAKMLKPLFINQKAPLASLATGLTKEAGPIFTSLKNKKIIMKAGKYKINPNKDNPKRIRNTMWKITPTWQNNWDNFRSEISEILDTIAPVKK